MKSQINEQRRSMKKVPDFNKMRFEAKQRAIENAKPVMDNELAQKLAQAKKTHGRVSTR